MQNSLEGKVVLVTGAGSGLGEATARAFGEAGCDVACVDVRWEEAERVSGEIRDHGLGIQCDVSDADEVFAAVTAATERFGHLDIVVNCAAIDYTLSAEEITIEQWDRVIGVNLRGPFLVSKAAWPIMKAQGGGHIVNVCSTASVRAWPNASAYVATKWGLMGLGRGLSTEGRPHGIRVTNLLPGGMRTHFFDRFVDQGIPMPDMDKLQDPANVARVILFAVSLPPESALQEVMVTPIDEPSWP